MRSHNAPPLSFGPKKGPGKLITIDGVDGCGKTTITDGLVRHLSERGIPVAVTRIPTTEMRDSRSFELLQQQGRTDLVDPVAFEVEYMADRIQHCRTFIDPELEKGSFVITDRYALSSIGSLLLRLPELRGVAVGAIMEECWFRDLCKYLTAPNLSFLLHADPLVMIARLEAREGEHDHGIDPGGYGELQGLLLNLAAANDMVLVETGRSPEESLASCLPYVDELLTDYYPRGRLT